MRATACIRPALVMVFFAVLGALPTAAAEPSTRSASSRWTGWAQETVGETGDTNEKEER